MSAPIPAFPHSHIERDARGVYTLRIDDAKSLNILASPVTLGLT
ncbi:enoyl-CoA hydratase, partial [Achromobacter ruhlandii]|nr:enoyl-CoA hydratase [Achromobacter ruhlandii]